jgi:hypothetical protein
MQNVFLTSTQLFLRDILSQYKVDPSLADPPVIIERPVYGAKIQRFLNFAAPGMMISIIFFSAIGLTALIFVVEKKEGLLERSWIAGVTTMEVMLAHIIVKFFIQFIQIILMVVFADVIFQVTDFEWEMIKRRRRNEKQWMIYLFRSPSKVLFYWQWHWSLYTEFVEWVMVSENKISWDFGLFSLCFFLLSLKKGLLISAVCEQEVEVMELALGSVFPILLSSGWCWICFVLLLKTISLDAGVIWPVEGMPPVMRLLSNFTPLTHTVESMRCIVSRGKEMINSIRSFVLFSSAWTITYFKVWFGFVISAAWSCGFFILAAILFALRK